MSFAGARQEQPMTTPGTEERCRHPLLNNGVCGLCENPINDTSAIPLSYIQENLTISAQAMDQLRQFKLNDLLRKEKLCLILDLDQTLLHTVFKEELLSSRDKGIYNQAESLEHQFNPTGNLYKKTQCGRLTKLRPYVRTFLEEASKIYELYVYTMGSRKYALDMAQLLDPEGKYFGHNVISGDDCTQEDSNGKIVKSLDLVMAPECLVVILDDTRAVWLKHEENLIHMKRYCYFDESDLVYGAKEDEDEADGALARVLSLLKSVHQRFFNSELDVDCTPKDVKRILREHQKEIASKRKRKIMLE